MGGRRRRRRSFPSSVRTSLAEKARERETEEIEEIDRRCLIKCVRAHNFYGLFFSSFLDFCIHIANQIRHLKHTRNVYYKPKAHLWRHRQSVKMRVRLFLYLLVAWGVFVAIRWVQLHSLEYGPRPRFASIGNWFLSSSSSRASKSRPLTKVRLKRMRCTIPVKQ